MFKALQYGTGLYFTFKNGKKTSGKDAMFDILQYRDPRSFSKKTRAHLDLITLQEDITQVKKFGIVGSIKFKIARYPGDIDIMEPIEYCCSLRTATDKIAKGIQEIGKGIKAKKGVYLGDFKAGLDYRYIELRDNFGKIGANGKIKGYKYSNLKKIVSKFLTKKLITNGDFKKFNELLSSDISVAKWTIIFKFARDFWIIRWSLKELIAGEKMIGQNKIRKKRLQLRDALKHKTICKLDLWAAIDGRYREITNFFIASYMDKTGESIAISPSLGSYREQIITDIKHYGDPNLDTYKPLKLGKRLWAMAVSIGDQKTLKKLYPLFAKGCAVLYQIDAEIETLLYILENNKLYKKTIEDGAIEIIIQQIESFKKRVAEIYDMDIYEELVFTIVDDIIDSPEDMRNRNGFIVKKLNRLSAILSDYYNKAAEDYLYQHDLQDINFYDFLLEK